MLFNERRFLMIKITTYSLTLKIVSSGRTEVVIIRIILSSMLRQHLRKLFTKTLLSESRGTNVEYDSLHSPVFSNAPPSFQTP